MINIDWHNRSIYFAIQFTQLNESFWMVLISHVAQTNPLKNCTQWPHLNWNIIILFIYFLVFRFKVIWSDHNKGKSSVTHPENCIQCMRDIDKKNNSPRCKYRIFIEIWPSVFDLERIYRGYINPSYCLFCPNCK